MPRVRRRSVLVVALAASLALATYAFTASNTVPGTKAGKGDGAITTVTGGTNVSCNFSPDVAVLSADELSVVAVQ